MRKSPQPDAKQMGDDCKTNAKQLQSYRETIAERLQRDSKVIARSSVKRCAQRSQSNCGKHHNLMESNPANLAIAMPFQGDCKAIVQSNCAKLCKAVQNCAKVSKLCKAICGVMAKKMRKAPQLDAKWEAL
jgi:hypothetical protein